MKLPNFFKYSKQTEQEHNMPAELPAWYDEYNNNELLETHYLPLCDILRMGADLNELTFDTGDLI